MNKTNRGPLKDDMHLPSLRVALLVSLVFVSSVQSAEVTVQSGPARVNLLELFTSEGCSTCPSAERWLSELRGSPRLWKEVVPVAFHVDYWDGLGWKDALAARAYTNRQRAYAASWPGGSVYTPAFVLNGAEWSSRDPGELAATKAPAGKLTATWHENGEVAVTYAPPSGAVWQAHAAILGLGLSTDVKAGENSGRRLVHDFVVLAYESGALSKAGDGAHATLHLPAEKAKHGQSALAVWVTEAGQLAPRQAAGGPL